jgi:uncharacterized protein
MTILQAVGGFMTAPPSPPLQGASSLEAIARSARIRGPAPVELWNPPYCGDIGLEIGRDGRWFYQGSPIGRPALVALFASVLRKDEDGRTYLVTPVEKIDVKVTDAPFLAVEMRLSGEGQAQDILLRTNLDEWVSVGSRQPLRFDLQPDGGLKPYVVVRGRLEALLVRAVYLELVELAEAASGSGAPGVWSGSIWWPFPEAALP